MVNLLDNSMFDNGAIECRNFTVSDAEGYYVCEWSWIHNRFSGRIQRLIFEALAKGERYISLNSNNPLERIQGQSGPVLEISWD